MTQIVAMFIALAGLCVLLYGLEWLFPAVREQPLWRSDSKTDALYLVFTPLVTRTVSKLVALAGVVLASLALGRPDIHRMAEGVGPIVSQPHWLIVVETFVLGDLLGYSIHRAFHAELLWNLHAEHHSSMELDWLSSLRIHPVNDIVSKLAQGVTLACLGFPLKAVAAYVPFLSM